jgi:hypothetical protein
MKPEERLREALAIISSLRDYVAEGGSNRMIGAGDAIREADRFYDDTYAALTAQSPAGVPPEPNPDAERFRWLCEDHDSRDDRLRRDEVLRRMPVMSYSAACSAVDNAMTGRSPVPDRSAGAPTTEPVAPIARDWMSRNVNEFASHFLRQYDKTTSVRESMMYAFVQTYDAPQAPVEPVAPEPEDERLSRLEAMAEDDGETWDLSTNDRAALAWAVETIKRASPISLPVEVRHWTDDVNTQE